MFPSENAISGENGGGGNRTRVSVTAEVAVLQHNCCNCPLPATVAHKLASGRIAYLCPECFSRRPRPSVYFVKSGGLVKIGYSARVHQRLGEFRTSCPSPVVLWHSVDGSRALESELHERFAADRSHGEWFHISDAIRNYVAEAQRAA